MKIDAGAGAEATAASCKDSESNSKRILQHISEAREAFSDVLVAAASLVYKTQKLLKDYHSSKSTAKNISYQVTGRDSKVLDLLQQNDVLARQLKDVGRRIKTAYDCLVNLPQEQQPREEKNSARISPKTSLSVSKPKSLGLKRISAEPSPSSSTDDPDNLNPLTSQTSQSSNNPTSPAKEIEDYKIHLTQLRQEFNNDLQRIDETLSASHSTGR